MYLDFEDHRPDTPRVEPAISAREGVLLSLVAHLLLVIFILVAPPSWFQPSTEVVPVKASEPPMRYVQMMPAIDRTELARRLAEDSDRDRRSATRERAPEPENAAPVSRGNTPEKVEGGPEIRAAGPETNQLNSPEPEPEPALPPQPSQPDANLGLLPELSRTPPALASGNLGRELRNPERYLQNRSFANPRGGNTDQDADIQFDSKGSDFGPWLARFRRQVERNWLVPQVAEVARGDVIVQFFVLRNGTIIDVRIIKAARIDALTVSAVNAIKMSNPAPSLPADYPDDRIQFTVHFYYLAFGESIPR